MIRLVRHPQYPPGEGSIKIGVFTECNRRANATHRLTVPGLFEWTASRLSVKIQTMTEPVDLMAIWKARFDELGASPLAAIGVLKDGTPTIAAVQTVADGTPFDLRQFLTDILVRLGNQ